MVPGCIAQLLWAISIRGGLKNSNKNHKYASLVINFTAICKHAIAKEKNSFI